MKQQQRQARSRAEILQAAMEEFGSRDYEQVNMERICKNHGISKGMMYHYYSNKDQLFLLCVEETFQALKAHIEGEMVDGNTDDTLQSVRNYFTIREYFFQEHPKYQRVFQNAMIRPPEHLRKEIQTLREPLRQLNRAYLERLVTVMTLRHGVERELATRYLESVEAVFRDMMFYYQTEKNLEDLHAYLETAMEMLDMVLFGVLRQKTGK